MKEEITIEDFREMLKRLSAPLTPEEALRRVREDELAREWFMEHWRKLRES